MKAALAALTFTTVSYTTKLQHNVTREEVEIIHVDRRANSARPTGRETFLGCVKEEDMFDFVLNVIRNSDSERFPVERRKKLVKLIDREEGRGRPQQRQTHITHITSWPPYRVVLAIVTAAANWLWWTDASRELLASGSRVDTATWATFSFLGLLLTWLAAVIVVRGKIGGWFS